MRDWKKIQAYVRQRTDPQALLCILRRHGGLEAADGHDSTSPSFLDFWQGRTRARENGAPARSLQLLKDERRVGLIRPARRRLSF